MGRKPVQLTYTCYLDGKPITEITDEQWAPMAERLSEVMSRYYTNHPEEYLKLLESDKKASAAV